MSTLYSDLMDEIKSSYESGVTMEEAEKLAGKFLYAQLQVAEELRVTDLDARMKKTGVKALKAALYLDEASKTDKKPSDTYLNAKVDSNELVHGEQANLDEAEVKREQLQNYLNIFKDGHIHFRTISKGSFNG